MYKLNMSNSTVAYKYPQLCAVFITVATFLNKITSFVLNPATLNLLTSRYNNNKDIYKTREIASAQ